MSAASESVRSWPRVLYWVTWFHRWAGVAFCLLFAMWFASGAVMIFVPYPALSERDRLARSEKIDFSKLEISPAEALKQAPGASALYLTSILSVPTYLLSRDELPTLAISGETGKALLMLSADQARHIAEAFAREPSARVEGPFDYDQWVVFQGFDAARPFYRVSLADRAGTAVYVSARTGQALQRTTRAERIWNWAGSIVHWIYFTPLRKSFVAWDKTVWWLSLAGLVVTTAGIWLGVLAVLKVRRIRKAGFSPFHGWMRWHHVLGLITGLFVFTWIFSGWLSMDHGLLFSSGAPDSDARLRMQGMRLPALAEAIPLGMLKGINDASGVSFEAVAGSAFVAARGKQEPRLYWPHSSPSGEPTVAPGLLLNAVRTAFPGNPVSFRGYVPVSDMYGLSEELPARTALFLANGPDPLGIYVDGVTGRLLVVMDNSRRAYAWLYYVLHTFNFPGLTSAPVLRRILVLIPLSVGFLFTITGAVLGVRRIKRLA